MSQNFIANRRLGRLRPRATKLFVPFLVLAACCFVLSFYNGRLEQPWMSTAMLAVAGLLVLLFWLIPVLRYLSAYVEVSTSGVLVRSGLMGQKRQEVSFSQVTAIELGKGRRIEIVTRDGEVIALPKLPRAKKLVAQLERLAV